MSFSSPLLHQLDIDNASLELGHMGHIDADAEKRSTIGVVVCEMHYNRTGKLVGSRHKMHVVTVLCGAGTSLSHAQLIA